jgi:hypothetical protein
MKEEIETLRVAVPLSNQPGEAFNLGAQVMREMP